MGAVAVIPRCPPGGEEDDRLRAKFEDVECPRFISVGSLLYTVCHTIPNIWYWWSVQLICVVVVCHPLWDVATRRDSRVDMPASCVCPCWSFAIRMDVMR